MSDKNVCYCDVMSDNNIRATVMSDEEGGEGTRPAATPFRYRVASELPVSEATGGHAARRSRHSARSCRFYLLCLASYGVIVA
jgi:hypothetical protein